MLSDAGVARGEALARIMLKRRCRAGSAWRYIRGTGSLKRASEPPEKPGNPHTHGVGHCDSRAVGPLNLIKADR